MSQFFSGLKSEQNLRNGWRMETFLARQHHQK
jgi:hypothetical protein